MTSMIRVTDALEGYIAAEMDRQRAQAGTAGLVAREAKALDWADVISSGLKSEFVVPLVELLVTKRLGAKLPELEVEIALQSEKVGPEVSKSIANLVDAVIERSDSITDARRADFASRNAAPAFYTGVWEAGAAYSKGAIATHDGALWHCEGKNVTDRPGTSSNWKLMHKTKGRS
jgi:hypothetical protein